MVIYSKESLETLRQRIDLVDLLSSHIDLKRTGASYKALCPFHDEKTPSFTLQKGDTHYHCFGCGTHGDAIHFLMTYLRMSFIESVESLAERFHVHLEKVEGKEYQGPSKRSLKETLDQASRFYHFYLLHSQEGQHVLEYLYKRGLDLDFIRRFQVGLAPYKPGMLRKFLHTKSIKDNYMLEAGLFIQTGPESYRDFFADRITFPIRDPAGAVIGFSARKYKEETFGGKYVNTPETPLFKKSKVLFGLNYSRKQIARDRKAIVVEGQIDALRLIQTGFVTTVAGQGTAFGEGHVRELLALGVNLVYLALDGDTAGRTAAFKIGDLFQREGVAVKVVKIPLGMDPDLVLRERGPLYFQQMLDESEDYLTFLISYLGKSVNAINTPAGKNEMIKEAIKQIRNWNDSIMVHESLKLLAKLTNTPEEIVGVGKEYIPNVYIKQSASVGLQTINPDRILETDLLRLLVIAQNRTQYVEIARKNLNENHFRDPVCRQFYHELIEKQEQDMLTLAIGIENGQEFITELLQKRVNREKMEESFIESIQKLLNRHWMEERELIKQKIHSGQCSDEEALLLAKQFDQLKSQKPTVVSTS